jgi:PIN domain nuclease of toxin-antitoxin system
MTSVLADTHIILWSLFDSRRLSAGARDALSAAVTSDFHSVFVSAISLVEVRYLVEKGRFLPETWNNLLSTLQDPSFSYKVLPVDQVVACTIEQIPRATIPDLPDRIIAATALVHELPLVTSDRKIRKSKVPTIW